MSIYVLFINHNNNNRYQIPIALVGLISCLALWDLFRYYAQHLGFHQYPLLRQIFVRFLQCGKSLVLLHFDN